MLIKEAKEITGGLSKPGKMPEGSYNLPAAACQTGAKLRKISGTPCHGCYAFKGRYNFSNVQKALARRSDQPEPSAMGGSNDSTLVKKKKHFRWHDSGDIQGVAHLKKYYEVCNNTPGTMHWLPTQERQYLPLEGLHVPRQPGHKIKQFKKQQQAWQRLDSLVHGRRSRRRLSSIQAGQ